MLRCKGNSAQCGEIAQRGTCLPTQESIPNGFLANRVHRIHGEHVLDVISSTGVAGGKGGQWDAEMEGPNVGKSPEGGSVCPLRSHIWGDFWPTQWTESMKNMVMMLYSVLESLGANGGSWGEMEMSPNVGEIPKMRKICTQQSQNWGYLWLTEYTEFMENMFLMFYQVLGSLGAEGGLWDAEMQRIFPLMWESRLRETYLHTKGSVLGLSLANRVHRIHGEHGLDVLSSAGVTGGRGWRVR